MEHNGQPSRRREAPSLAPSTITEICRRYFATATALARVMGLPLTEAFMHDWRESITACFIESSRAGVRLPSAVQLPPLATGTHGTPEAETASVSEVIVELPGTHVPPVPEPTHDPLPLGEGAAPVTSTTGDTPLPTRIPAEGDWPCAGHEISRLKPAQLHLLVARAGFRAHADVTVLPLLAALQIERGTRIEQGKRRIGEESQP